MALLRTLKSAGSAMFMLNSFFDFCYPALCKVLLITFFGGFYIEDLAQMQIMIQRLPLMISSFEP